MKKILVISCSPRKNGNTELLLREAAKGASDSGAEVEFVRLYDMKIEPCRECLACHSAGECAVDDDMRLLYPKLVAADAFILGSPIFFMGIPSHGKAFIDRCQPFWVMKYRFKQKFIAEDRIPRKGAFISVGGTRIKHLFDGAVRTVKALFAVLEIEFCDDLLMDGIDEKGEVLKHPEFLEKSRELGRRLVNQGQRQESSLQ